MTASCNKIFWHTHILTRALVSTCCPVCVSCDVGGCLGCKGTAGCSRVCGAAWASGGNAAAPLFKGRKAGWDGMNACNVHGNHGRPSRKKSGDYLAVKKFVSFLEVIRYWSFVFYHSLKDQKYSNFCHYSILHTNLTWNTTWINCYSSCPSICIKLKRCNDAANYRNQITAKIGGQQTQQQKPTLKDKRWSGQHSEGT